MTKQVDDTDHRRRATVCATEPAARTTPRPRNSGRTTKKRVNYFVAAALLAVMAAPVPAVLATASSAQEEGGFGLPTEETATESVQIPESTFMEDTTPDEAALDEARPETTIATSERTAPPAGMITMPANEYTGGAESVPPSQAVDQYGEPTRLAETGGLGPMGAALLVGAAALAFAVFASRSRKAARSDIPQGGDDDLLPRA